MLILIISILYFLPALNAIFKGKRNAFAISALNLLLGWTVIGWIVAIIWSFTNDAPLAVVQKLTVEAPAAIAAARIDDLAFLAELREERKAKGVIG